MFDGGLMLQAWAPVSPPANLFKLSAVCLSRTRWCGGEPAAALLWWAPGAWVRRHRRGPLSYSTGGAKARYSVPRPPFTPEGNRRQFPRRRCPASDLIIKGQNQRSLVQRQTATLRWDCWIGAVTWWGKKREKKALSYLQMAFLRPTHGRKAANGSTARTIS